MTDLIQLIKALGFWEGVAVFVLFSVNAYLMKMSRAKVRALNEKIKGLEVENEDLKRGIKESQESQIKMLNGVYKELIDMHVRAMRDK